MESAKTRAAVERSDAAVGRVLEATDALPWRNRVSLLVTTDHGMVPVTWVVRRARGAAGGADSHRARDVVGEGPGFINPQGVAGGLESGPLAVVDSGRSAVAMPCVELRA